MGRFSNRLIRKWPVYGVIPLRFENISFNMYSKGDDNIAYMLYYNISYHEHKDLSLFLRMAERSKVIFDIGANTGIYSILSNRINPDARIFAFEPYPVNVTRLKKNLELNNTKADIVQKALGNEPGIIQFAVPADNSIADTSSARIEFSKNTYDGKIQWKTIDVEQITLDAFINEKNFDRIDLVKIDVEGYEEAVFKGAIDFFKKYKPVIQCEIFLNKNNKEFFENFLKENGYTAYLILNDGLLNVGKEMLPNPGSLNYLFSTNDLKKQFSSFAELQKLASEILKN